MASAGLNKTFSGAGTNNKKGTISLWMKRSGLSSSQQVGLTTAGASGGNAGLQFGTDDRLDMYLAYDGSWRGIFETTRVFRDTSAWYHIVVAWDTTQATDTNRLKFYVNGVQETSFVSISYPPQDQVTTFGNAAAHFINYWGSGAYFDGLMTHIHYTDGYTYAATDFGETDSTSGIWKPKTAPSVTYGTNGFFLKFENSGAMGTDSSGNSNTFTTTGTITQAVDTPSNVFAVMNPLAMGTASSGLTFSNGNLTSTNSSSGHRSVLSTLAVSTGKWYYEGKSVTTGGAYPTFGIFNIDAAFDAGTFFTSTANGYGYNSNGHIYHNNGSLITGLSTWTDGDIIGIALDATNDKLYISKNGSWQNSGDPSNNTGGISITSDITWCFAAHLNDAGTNPVQNYNFGNGYFGTTAVASANADANGFGAFEYAVPTGFYTLCTKNIKEFG